MLVSPSPAYVSDGAGIAGPATAPPSSQEDMRPAREIVKERDWAIRGQSEAAGRTWRSCGQVRQGKARLPCRLSGQRVSADRGVLMAVTDGTCPARGGSSTARCFQPGRRT